MQLQLSIVGNRRLAYCSSGLVKLPMTCPPITHVDHFPFTNLSDLEGCSPSDGDVDHGTNQSVKSA
jgi:hypothetical protein